MFELISWKDSFEKISKDLEQARKKKQALDDLFNSEKISALTYQSLDNELTKTISEIEARQEDLADKMASKISDLEKQVGTLEMFLANSEIQYAAGETDEESHASEIGAFSLGLDVVKQELNTLKNVVTKLMPEVVAPPPPQIQSETEEVATTEEVAEASEISVETPLEIPIEETTDVESVSKEVEVEEPMETSTGEMPSEELVEASVAEETAQTQPEFRGEETLEGEEMVISEEAEIEEETEALTEEAISHEEETEALTEEAISYEEEETITEEETY